MNPYTGHLLRVDQDCLNALRKGYEVLPKDLQGEAEKALAGASEAQIDLRGSGPLRDWAAKRRKEKRKAKTAARSRRENRRG